MLKDTNGARQHVEGRRDREEDGKETAKSSNCSDQRPCAVPLFHNAVKLVDDEFVSDV